MNGDSRLHRASESHKKTYNRPPNRHRDLARVIEALAAVAFMIVRRKGSRLRSSIVIALMLGLAGSGAFAADAPWADRSYRYVVIDQDVRDVLQEFGRNLSLPVEVSSAVNGEVRGDIHADSAQAFLEQVCRSNGLAWFFDGYVLHVAAREELGRRSFDLDGVDVSRLSADIEAARIGSPLSADFRDGRHRLEAMGPPAWLAEVAQRVEDSRRTPAPSAPGEVRVFRGSVAQPAVEQ